jgi:hypothetical protein
MGPYISIRPKIAIMVPNVFWSKFSSEHACRNLEIVFFSFIYLIILVDLQLDAQNSYLFTYNTFIKIFYIFRAFSCSSSKGLHRNCIYAASGIVTL